MVEILLLSAVEGMRLSLHSSRTRDWLQLSRVVEVSFSGGYHQEGELTGGSVGGYWDDNAGLKYGWNRADGVTSDKRFGTRARVRVS